ncbi:glycoside hydrolase family 88/105 protein [Geofilum sp. OHC36d9]|uniref:glycoside hydrolase family 88/105 protein n=1 Tax=Geofilum sp. OHC36d9 TaxID=3458413 RepID=UPI0040344F9C
MKTSVRVLLTTCGFMWLTALSVAQQLPDKKEVLNKMVLANDYFMQKFPDVGMKLVTDAVRPSNIWTRGVYYEGLMALHTIYPKEAYYDYAYAWADFHKWGFRGGNTTRNADNYCAGQTYIDLYNISPDPEKIKNVRICIDMLVNTPQNDDWWWIDALQMGMPVFAKLGVLTNDYSYFSKMLDMYMYTKTRHGGKGLFNPEDGLWWRDKDFVPPYKEPNGEDCYWARGNGWVYAALVRVLDIMPTDAPGYDEYMTMFKQMSVAVNKVQRKDGFWNVSLHDAKNFGGKETSGTALFVYGMAWGINNGILDAKKYLPVVVSGWNAIANESLHEDGFLGYVQGTGKEPKDGQPVNYTNVPDFEDYGLGCFLLAGTEVYKLK